ncbi:hypothetical protein C2E21_2984 [Chlorella sorokiniana]|uniref:HhH-GPD domain-containing protein n=1 Tax=Chlorella sorokiniana TaxID=3076 RepID=A0A2P6TX48_CHLSO|nr:hypothetical protein C2E21_2984 [Chlorella sorokiniana]|eukprot:PRW58639.1 hypothetical protein C2E21_2984 [Chlorella sorokiniana]
MLAARAYAGPYPAWPAPTAEACRAVAERLAAVHGWPHLKRQQGLPAVGCEERRTVLDSLVRTLLSQNTTDKTSGRAFATLKQRFPSWEAVRQAPLEEVADAIRVGGLAEIKAGRIQDILGTLKAERGECSLEHLRGSSAAEVKAELSRFKGVGAKTISCVLLFGLGHDDFAVDTHVWEITKALGWTPLNASRDQAYAHLNELVPDDLKYDLHVLLVNHGKSCPACAKTGSAKHRGAAASGASAACPIAEFKPPPSTLKPYPSSKQRGGKGGAKKAAAAAADGGSSGEDAGGQAAAAAAAGGGKGARKLKSEGEQARAAGSGGKRQKVAAPGAAAAVAKQTDAGSPDASGGAASSPIASGPSMPQAAAYFPLTSRNLTSAFPAGQYEGESQNLVWRQDPSFGEVLDCDEDRQSYVSIPGVQYGTDGGFAVVFWAQMRLDNGTSFDYAYSHVNARNTEFAFDPNEVAVFLPEKGHPDSGMVRAIVRDSQDVRTNGSLPFFLDSNGCVSDPECPSKPATNVSAGDGQWHLLGVTTLPEGGKGFQLYVDGQLAAEASRRLYTDSEGFPKAPTGGAPMNLTGNITLCARSDLYPTRFFGGSIAHLFIYDTPLSADQMQEIYNTGQQSMAAMNASASSPSTNSTNTRTRSVSSGDALQQAAQQLSANSTEQAQQAQLAQQAQQNDPTASAQPAADCVTPCEAYNGALACFTDANEIRLCTTDSSLGSGDSNSTMDSLGLTSPDQSLSYQPAADCVSTCEQLNGSWVCYTTTSAVRMCLPSDALSAMDSALQSMLADSPANSSTSSASSQQAAAQLGGQPLCSALPIQGIVTVQSCPTGYQCTALSRQQLATNFGSQLNVSVGDLGVCAYAPKGFLLPDAATVPPAMAFFPLAEQTLHSFPLPDYTGSAEGAGIVEDPLFGSALSCSSTDRDLVALDAVQYARSGAFSVNLWFKPGNMSGTSLSYLFSHRGTTNSSNATSNTGWGPNQIQVYLPNEDHPSYGVVRTYVKDYDDVPLTMGAATWLDSDGTKAYSDVRDPSLAAQLYDGGWHMATVTSQPGGGKGYRLFLDGMLVNEIQEGVSYTTPEGFPIPVDGGDPILLDGNVVLCVRSDDPTGRHFDGRVAYLSLFDEALDDSQVSALYGAVAANMTAASTAPSSSLPSGGELPVFSPKTTTNATQLSVTGRPCQFPALYGGELVTDCIPIAGIASCQVAEGVWEPCQGAANISSAQTQQLTISGQECVFPGIYAGQTITECTALEPGAPLMCPTSDGTWSQCASEVTLLPSGYANQTMAADPAAGVATNSSREPVIAAHGTICLLPLLYNGVQVDGCVGMGGMYMCWGADTAAWESCPDDLLSKATPGPTGISAATVPLPVVPQRTRVTTGGQACSLPVVFQGELLDDCIMRDVAWSCLTAANEWQRCNLGATPAPTNAQGQLLVAQRTTTSNASCLLPAVYCGNLWFDCVKYTEGDSTADICPTQAGDWDLCATAGLPGAMLPDPKPLNVAAVLGRRAPGRVGMLCPIEPSDNALHNCAEDLICVPLSDLTFNSTNSSVQTGLEQMGYCRPAPAGGTFGTLQYLRQQNVEPPLAFFPLTGGELDSLLLPPYNGSTSGMPLPAWVDDATFNSTLNCTAASRSAIILDNVPYASNGSWAINLWMRRLPSSSANGSLFQYLFSHTGPGSQSGFGETPNTVSIYLADRNNPAYGTVRVIVTDQNDRDSVLTYLDSDGQIESMTGQRRPKHADVNNGEWHMLTLSTYPNDTLGYTLFVDGQPAGSLSSASRINGSLVDVTGGDPAQLTSNIYLCSRSDSDPDRFFDGSVAHLMLFNSALDPKEVAGLYSTYKQNNGSAPLVSSAAGPGGDPALVAAAGMDPSSGHTNSTLSGGEIAGIVLASIGGAMALATLLAMAVVGYRKRRQGKRFERFADEAAIPPPAGGGAAVPVAAGVAPLPGQLSIQLSSGRSLSLNSKDFDADSVAGNHPRYHSALSDVSTVVGGPTPRAEPPAPALAHSLSAGPTRGAAVAGSSGAPTVTTLPRSYTAPTRPSVEPLPGSASGAGSVFDDSASMASARSSLASESLSIEPGKRGIFKKGSARVVLPPTQEDTAGPDPRSPFEP